jgi:hypothetical protein
MLKTYRVISSVFILFLFGFTLITASPAFAEDNSEFIDCQQMEWKDGRQEKKNCFRDLARQLVGDSSEFIACQQMEWKDGGQKKKNCFRDLARDNSKEQAPQSEVNLCLASLKEIDERTFRNCNSAEEEIDTSRGGVCVGGIMWHNRYGGGADDEIRKCGESKELPNQKECSSALSDLALAIEAFNEAEQYPTRGMVRILTMHHWWRVGDVGSVNGSWRDARDACGF